MASGSKSSGREYSRNGPQEPELLALFLPQINNTASQEEFHVFHETAEKKKNTHRAHFNCAVLFFSSKGKREFEFEFPPFSHVFKRFSCFFVCKIVK